MTSLLVGCGSDPVNLISYLPANDRENHPDPFGSPFGLNPPGSAGRGKAGIRAGGMERTPDVVTKHRDPALTILNGR
jgi:hypothetical protein